METVIIDAHKEAIPHWFKEYIILESPLVEVRIDMHHDMCHKCSPLPAQEGWHILRYLARRMSHLVDYVKNEVNEANFTCPAFHYGILGAVYHFNPRSEKVDAYGRVLGEEFVDTPRTKKEAFLIGGKRTNRIVWDEGFTKLKTHGGKKIPVPKSITFDEFKRDLEESIYPPVIGFDLDAICTIGEKDQSALAISRRLEKTRLIMECVPSPALVYIARSQTPRAYVPPDRVDDLESAALGLIEAVYS